MDISFNDPSESLSKQWFCWLDFKSVKRCSSRIFLKRIAGKTWTTSPPFPYKKLYLPLYYNWPIVGKMFFLVSKVWAAASLSTFSWFCSIWWWQRHVFVRKQPATFLFSVVMWWNFCVLWRCLECFS